MRARLTFLVLASALVFAACPPREPVPPPPQVDEAAGRAELERLRSAYIEAYNAGDAARVAELFTDNGTLATPAREPVRGRDAIRSAVAEDIERFGNLRATSQETRSAADWAVDFGTSSQRWRAEPPPGAPDELTGAYAALIVRGADGQWRVERLIVSADQPLGPPPAGATPPG